MMGPFSGVVVVEASGVEAKASALLKKAVIWRWAGSLDAPAN
jgi:hypothetical protein